MFALCVPEKTRIHFHAYLLLSELSLLANPKQKANRFGSHGVLPFRNLPEELLLSQSYALVGGTGVDKKGGVQLEIRCLEQCLDESRHLVNIC